MAAQEAIAQNLANASTTGYKQDVPRYEAFQNMLLDRLSGAASRGQVGSLGTGVTVQSVATDFGQGALQRTGNSLDVALTGDAYLAVKTAGGVLYTPDGSLTHDASGTLIQSGTLSPVLDVNNNPIVIPTNAKTITISPQGMVSADNKFVAQLALVGLDKNSGATKVGDNDYTATKPTVPTAGSSVEQGFLEASNVSTVRAMVAMIQAQRTYETNSKMLQTEDAVTAKAINSVASMQ